MYECEISQEEDMEEIGEEERSVGVIEGHMQDIALEDKKHDETNTVYIAVDT